MQSHETYYKVEFRKQRKNKNESMLFRLDKALFGALKIRARSLRGEVSVTGIRVIRLDSNLVAMG